jgi:hypothetical protein
MSRRGLLIGALAAVTASVASANYHFVHYAGQGASVHADLRAV